MNARPSVIEARTRPERRSQVARRPAKAVGRFWVAGFPAGEGTWQEACIY